MIEVVIDGAKPKLILTAAAKLLTDRKIIDAAQRTQNIELIGGECAAEGLELVG